MNISVEIQEPAHHSLRIYGADGSWDGRGFNNAAGTGADLNREQTLVGGYRGMGPPFGTDVGVRATFLTHQQRRSQGSAAGAANVAAAADACSDGMSSLGRSVGGAQRCQECQELRQLRHSQVSTAPSEASPRFQDADKLVSRISASTARRIRRKRAAEREAKDKRGASPLFAASDKGNVAVVRFLLDCGARVNLQGGPDHGTHAVVTFASPLYAGCQNCNEEIVQILLDARADVNERTGDGATALMVAAQNGNEKVYRRVLAACDTTTINLEDPTGLMALYFGAQNGHTGIVGMLLKANASTDVRSLDGATPLFKAAQNGHQEVVVPLLQHRADVFAAAHDGTTPLILAAYNGHVYVVDVLVPEIINRAGVKGLDISMQSSGATAMFVAAQAGKDGIVRKLGLYGAYVPELLAVEIAHHGSTWVNRHELQLRAGSHPAHAIRDHAGMNIDIAVGCDSIITVYSNTTDPVYIPCGRFAHMQASHVVEMAGRSPNTSALCLDGVLLAPHRYVPGGSEVLICAVSLQAPTLAGPRLNAANMQLRRDLIHVLERHGLGQELLMAMFTKTVDEQVVPGFRLGEAPRSRTSGK